MNIHSYDIISWVIFAAKNLNSTFKKFSQLFKQLLMINIHLDVIVSTFIFYIFIQHQALFPPILFVHINNASMQFNFLTLTYLSF